MTLRRHRALALAAFASLAIVACVLNPQPLPPGDETGAAEYADSGVGFGGDNDKTSDSAPPPLSPEAGQPAVDAGDAGDAGDADADAL